MKRRKFIRNSALALGAATVAGGVLRFTKSKSGNYSDYFKKLNTSLRQYKKANPFLILDLNQLDANIDTLKTLIPNHAKFRIVVKSLPSIELVEYIQKRAGTNKLMIFNQPFLTQLSLNANQDISVLFGKPMPVNSAHFYYETLIINNGFNPAKQVQWLVDTELRIKQYIELAKELNQKLLLNLELDVGLHRGGFDSIEKLRTALKL